MSEIAGTEVGSAVVEAITGQGDLLTTLSLAVIGGLFAFAVQIVLHNEGSGSKRISLDAIWALWGCVFAQFFSMITGYFMRGTLVASVPAIFGSKFAVESPLQKNNVSGLYVAQHLAFWQFALFALGIALMVVFLFCNAKKLKG